MLMRGVSDREDPISIAFQVKRWLVAALGVGFFGLAADVFMEHYFTMHSMRPAQWIPLAFGPVAGAIALATAWRFPSMTLRPFSIVSWVSIGVGALGLYYHGRALARNLETFTDLLDVNTLFAILPHVPPLGAPMAFVSMGVLGLLVHTGALKLKTLLLRRRDATSSDLDAVGWRMGAVSSRHASGVEV